MEEITTAMTASFSTVSTQILGLIALVIGAGLGVVGAKMAVTSGINMFRSLIAKS